MTTQGDLNVSFERLAAQNSEAVTDETTSISLGKFTDLEEDSFTIFFSKPQAVFLSMGAFDSGEEVFVTVDHSTAVSGTYTVAFTVQETLALTGETSDQTYSFDLVIDVVIIEDDTVEEETSELTPQNTATEVESTTEAEQIEQVVYEANLPKEAPSLPE